MVSLRVDVDFNIEVSNCAQEWATATEEQKPDIFETNLLTQEETVAQCGSLVGKEKLIYKIGDLFYSEVDAWKVILKAKIGGLDIPVSSAGIASPKTPNSPRNQQNSGSRSFVEKLINAFRPSNGLLKRMNLRMGENDLSYEYFISSTATDKINVKIFLYPHNAKIVISDIDGTITK
jgi:LNS2 (Lipin/Ned1/Smp2)